MQNNPRHLTVGYTPTDYPKIILAGAWLSNCGFKEGDRISVSETEPNTLVIKLDMPRDQWQKIREARRRLSKCLAAAKKLGVKIPRKEFERYEERNCIPL